MIRHSFKKQIINSFFLLLGFFLIYYIIVSISYNYLLFHDFKVGNKNILNSIANSVFNSYENNSNSVLFDFELEKIRNEIPFLDSIIIMNNKNEIVYPKNPPYKSNYFTDIKDETYKSKRFNLFYKKMIFSGQFYYKGTVIIKINIAPYAKHQYTFLLLIIIIFTLIFYFIGKMILKKFNVFLKPLYDFVSSIEKENDENSEIYENEVDLFIKKLQEYKEQKESYIKQIDKKTKELFIENKRVQNLLNFRKKMISSTSHELKIPLSIIIGYIEQIKTNPKKYMEKGMFYIDKNLKRLQNMIDNLMRLFKVENNKYSLNIKKNSLIELLEEIHDEYLPQIEKRNINFVVTKPEKCIEIEFDFEEIKLAMCNLINNSIRYTKENGEIELYCKILKNKIKLGVKDTGTGIEKEKINKIFDWYFQVDKSPSIGLGIGLAIAKNTVQAHKWEIKIKSSVNKGTDIYMIIPYKNKT